MAGEILTPLQGLPGALPMPKAAAGMRGSLMPFDGVIPTAALDRVQGAFAELSPATRQALADQLGGRVYVAPQDARPLVDFDVLHEQSRRLPQPLPPPRPLVDIEPLQVQNGQVVFGPRATAIYRTIKTRPHHGHVGR